MGMGMGPPFVDLGHQDRTINATQKKLYLLTNTDWQSSQMTSPSPHPPKPPGLNHLHISGLEKKVLEGRVGRVVVVLYHTDFSFVNVLERTSTVFG